MDYINYDDNVSLVVRAVFDPQFFIFMLLFWFPCLYIWACAPSRDEDSAKAEFAGMLVSAFPIYFMLLIAGLMVQSIWVYHLPAAILIFWFFNRILAFKRPQVPSVYYPKLNKLMYYPVLIGSFLTLVIFIIHRSHLVEQVPGLPSFVKSDDLYGDIHVQIHNVILVVLLVYYVGVILYALKLTNKKNILAEN